MSVSVENENENEKMSKNMEIWEKVCKTDPTFTKNFKGKGGFSGTAVCAQWQKLQATQLWGPYGARWGVKDDVFEVIKTSGEQYYDVMLYRGKFYYPEGSFNIFAEMDIWSFSTKYKNWSKANEIHKKLSTDALTKGLSMLGFSADVFMGKFDDNKYIQALKDELSDSQPKPADKSKPANKKPPAFDFLKAMQKIKTFLGDEPYYKVLGLAGFEKSNEITEKEKQRHVYKELLKVTEEKYDKNCIALACIEFSVDFAVAAAEASKRFKTDITRLKPLQRAEIITWIRSVNANAKTKT